MKAGTFTQLRFHLVFSVKYRKPHLRAHWRTQLFEYIFGIMRNRGVRPYIVNGADDHVHILFGAEMKESIPELVRDIKSQSCKFMKENKWVGNEFSWQNGYAIFTVGRSEVHRVYTYISNQELHHKSLSFEDEYKDLLQLEQIKFEEQFLFDIDPEKSGE